MSIFSGKKALRHQFEKIAFGDMAATTLATAQLFIKFNNWGRLSFIDNTLVDGSNNPIDVTFALVHPDADGSDVANRIEWIEVPGLRVINYSVGDAPGISFDPGTKMYVYNNSGLTPASGALRIASWG